MKKKLLRFGLLAVALAIIGFLIAASGIIPLKASDGHWSVTQWILEFGMRRSIATQSLGIEARDLSDPDLVLQGAMHYEMGCRSCHGEPGMPIPKIASRMLPQPADLTSRIRETTPERLFYVVKHGMKFTGMPAWPADHRDDEVWAMVAFLQKVPTMNPAEYRRLVHGERVGDAPIHEMAPSSTVPAVAAQTCIRCHGTDGLGRGNGASPRLAGQRAEYLLNALVAYSEGKRHSGTMEPVAAGLDPETFKRVASYYARLLPPARKTEMSARPDALARGREIAHEGIRSQRVPACVECHGPAPKRGKPSYPSLAGQSAKYLERQLVLFKEERRGGSAYAHLMRPVASRLTLEQMRDVALYFESLAPINWPGSAAISP